MKRNSPHNISLVPDNLRTNSQFSGITPCEKISIYKRSQLAGLPTSSPPTAPLTTLFLNHLKTAV